MVVEVLGQAGITDAAATGLLTSADNKETTAHITNHDDFCYLELS
jgi:hypothetical protein